MKQHYVPQTYLKGFANYKNEFYKLNIKTQYPSIEPKTPAQVCYLKDYYTIKDPNILSTFQLEDPLFLEKHFKNFEDKYDSIFKKIVKEGELSYKESRIFIDGIVSIKTRNPFFGKIVINKEKDEQILRKRASSLESEAKTVFKNINVDDSIEKGIKNSLSEESIESLRLQLLLSEHVNGIETISLIKSILETSQWVILDTGLMCSFITSDNPGFCLDENNKIHNTKFAGYFIFVFPLSPQYCLMVSNKNQENIHFPKPIYFKKSDCRLVDLLNKASIIHCNKEIYSHRRETLEKYLSYWSDKDN
jgi:polyhydroxyalkanoate synthesis regulator phasin